MRRNPASRSHKNIAWWAFMVHRLSGLGLAIFLPIHFFLLSQALRGEAALDQALALTHLPLIKFAEWGLVMLLTLHLVGGIRLILIEFGPWRGVRSGWITATVFASFGTGALFLFNLLTTV